MLEKVSGQGDDNGGKVLQKKGHNPKWKKEKVSAKNQTTN